VIVMSNQQEGRTSANAKHAAGEHRVRYADLFDAEVRPHNERLRAAADVGPRDRVLDIGCGTGQSTRDAARAAGAGSVLGVDLSAQVLELARELGAQEGLHNVTYLQADAQVHRFPSRHFDLCISRFGVMFFADPIAAFTNIGHALHSGGRMVLMVWQDRDRNEWSSKLRQSITAGTTASTPPPSGPDAFSLADPAIAEGILAAAGFVEVRFIDVDEPVYYGEDTATAYDFVLGLLEIKQVVASLEPAMVEPALQRLRATLAEHDTGSGVFFNSSAWIITAQRP
jgi:SAM-dependent methyltransferase